MEFAIIGVIVVLIIYISLYNSLIKIKNKVEESYSSIDVYLSKRFNAITNCVEVCKGYCKHEKEVLERVIELRKGSISDIASTNEEISDMNKNLVLLSESYPELKADTQFINLQKVIVDCENHIQAARRFYNSNVNHLNDKVQVFPSNIVAKLHKITKKDYFKAEDAERNNVIVDKF